MQPQKVNPLRECQHEAGADFMAYADCGVEVVESFGAYEAEYAAIRKGVGILDMPQRGILVVRGSDRMSFLQAMLTQDIGPKKFGGGQACRAFLLSRAGRIDADIIVGQFDDGACHLDMDRFDAGKVLSVLENHVFTEDVVFEDASPHHQHIALHGPRSAALVEHLGAKSLASLSAYQCETVSLDGHECLLYRRDEAGVPGLHLIVAGDDAEAVYMALAGVVGGLVPEVEGGRNRHIPGRAIGWLAYNTARIEAGTVIHHIDFGPNSLPHESGVLGEAVSFTKGCYLGQEIVARMENLGHPKRILVGLKLDDQRMPIVGSEVFDHADKSTVIGAVTSSSLSPMLGGTAIAFGMIKWGKHRPDIELLVPADGELVSTRTHRLGFLP